MSTAVCGVVVSKPMAKKRAKELGLKNLSVVCNHVIGVVKV